MTSIRKVALISLFLFAAGCSAQQVKPIDNTLALKKLSEAMINKKVAFKGHDLSEGGKAAYCDNIFNKKKLEAAVSAWAPKQVAWENRTSNNVGIEYSWNCWSFSTIAQDFSPFPFMITLGLFPMINEMQLLLSVDISQNNKYIYSGRHQFTKTVYSGLLTGKDDQYEKAADILLDKFTQELYLKGALDH